MKSTISTDTEPASVFCRGSILRLLGPCLFAILSVVAMTGCGESAKAREVFARQSTENVQEEQA
ncbi:MAG: hypothetical protein K2P71_06570, partial [Lachnospiraceae bacterium]|nr:hypothetical protein [Lachnospiraceae bacterium]